MYSRYIHQSTLLGSYSLMPLYPYIYLTDGWTDTLFLVSYISISISYPSFHICIATLLLPHCFLTYTLFNSVVFWHINSTWTYTSRKSVFLPICISIKAHVYPGLSTNKPIVELTGGGGGCHTIVLAMYCMYV